jgi:hypothetical protein
MLRGPLIDIIVEDKNNAVAVHLRGIVSWSLAIIGEE